MVKKIKERKVEENQFIYTTIKKAFMMNECLFPQCFIYLCKIAMVMSSQYKLL